MDKLKELLMKLLDVNKQMDECLQGLCEWYEKERSPHAPAEPVPDTAPILPPTTPVPDGLFAVPAPDEFPDLKPDPPAEAPATVVYEQAPADGTAPTWGEVSYS